MRVPTSADPDVQQAFREIWTALDRLAGSRSVDLHGRRVINAGQTIDPFDYATLDDLRQAMLDTGLPEAAIFQTLTVRGTTRLNGQTFVRRLEDAGIVFAKVGGRLDTDVDDLSWRYTNKTVRLGITVTLRWQHGVELRTSGNTVLIVGGEDNNVTSQLARIALGLATSSYPSVARNGAGLEAQLADGSALTTMKASEMTATKFNKTSPQTYTPSNVTTDRSYDADATTIDELADVLGTLIGDLQAIGLVA